MATRPATVVIHETRHIEYRELDTTDSETWLRTVLAAAAIDYIQLGPQIRLYFDRYSDRDQNTVANSMAHAYSAPLPGTIRGPVALCRNDSKSGMVHDLFVAQIDRIIERFGRDLETDSPRAAEIPETVSILTQPGPVTVGDHVHMPSDQVQDWIAARLGTSFARVEFRELDADMLMLHDPLSADDRNYTADYICATLIPTQRVFVRGPALVCRRDPATGQLGDLEPEQITRLLARFSRVVLDRLANILGFFFLRHGYYITIEHDRPSQKFGFRFDQDAETEG